MERLPWHEYVLIVVLAVVLAWSLLGTQAPKQTGYVCRDVTTYSGASLTKQVETVCTPR